MSKTTLFDSRIKKYAYREAAQIYKEIGASPDGLSREQVEEMREQYGANSFAERKNDTMVCRLRVLLSIRSMSFSLFWGSFRW